MFKRLSAFFVSFCFVFGFVCSSFVTFAVAPLVLVEAALVSYVASTGYKLWVDNGTGSDVLGLVSDLYDTWLSDISGVMPMTLEEFATGNYVFTDNSGNIILSKTAADTFQQFSDWLAAEYSITAGGSSVTVIQGGGSVTWPTQSSGTFEANYVISPLAFLTGPVYDEGFRFAPGNVYNQLVSWCNDYSNCCVQIRYPAVRMPVEGVNGNINVYSPGSYNINNNIPSVARLSFQGKIAQDGNIFIYSLTALNSISGTFQMYPGKLVDGTTVYLNSASIVYSNSGGLALGLAQDVIDKTAGLIDGKSLVLDVGASAGDTANEIVDTVISGYDAVTGTLPVTDSIVDTVVIDTPVQPYPDVDSLGLPELGLALTTRFPFSIPWDISVIYSAISAPSEPPVKTFDLIPSSVLARWGINANTSITIDLTDQKYSVLLAIIHWSCIVGFCFGLAVMTKRYVWTTGG